MLTIRRHEHCMRGLHWEFLTTPHVSTKLVVERLEAMLGSRARCVREKWGTRDVTRLTVPFEAEYRIGDRDGQVSLLHRMSAKEETRAMHHEQLRALLEALADVGEASSTVGDP